MTKLHEIAKQLVAPGRGILAADQSTGSMTKLLKLAKVDSTAETRRQFRQLLFTTDKIEQYISGVILYDETIRQKSDSGKFLVTVLEEKGIVPGIKVDEGTLPLPLHEGDKFTRGIDRLAERLPEYVKFGAKFAKWRAVFSISAKTPSDALIDINASDLALYALLCQEAKLVPIVEPEVLFEGNHTADQSATATTRVLKRVFEKLTLYGVDLEGMLLKPNWVHEGLDLKGEPDSIEVAKATVAVLKHTVPDAVPGIVFLSGGDSPEDSTKHLDALNEVDENLPWELSFSFGRALINKALEVWEGKESNVAVAQQAFYDQAALVSMGRGGDY